MKNKLLLFAVLLPFSIFSQTPKVDSLAVRILDRMSDVIGELHSCRYNLSVAQDKDGLHGLEKQYTEHEVLMKGPDKMLVQSNGSDSHKGFWYNGKHMVYYSYKENNFSVMDAPDSILKTIDTIHTNYGIDFPAADFFYPAFTDDVLEEFPTLVFLGDKIINGKECFHIMADNDKVNAQIWITNDAYTLPAKLLIRYKQKEGNPQYEATFSNWQINPEFPDRLFEFTPPPEAKQIAIMARSVNP